MKYYPKNIYCHFLCAYYIVHYINIIVVHNKKSKEKTELLLINYASFNHKLLKIYVLYCYTVQTEYLIKYRDLSDKR